eukprot:3637711-Pyramimonas_sp.AAC.1
MDSWKSIWEGYTIEDDASPTSAADEQRGDLADTIRRPPAAALPVPTVEHVRRAALTFKWRAGLGADAMPPRAIPLLSDAVMANCSA